MPTPLHIAVFSYCLPVVGQKRGGIERVAHDLSNGLSRRGHKVTVFTHDPKPYAASYEVRELPWRRFVGSWIGRRLTMGFLGNFLAIAPDYGEYDLIIAHGDSLFVPFIGKPVIRVMHGNALCEALHARRPARFVLQLLVYLQELLTAITQRRCVAVSKNSVRFNPFIKRTIVNGVDLSLFYPSAEEKSMAPSILFVGDLNGRKRGQRLIDWFVQEVLPQHPTAILQMVSNPGPEMPGVSYHTGITSEELAKLYRTAWIYASPSTYEGFGLPYVEAMASGTPVIATPNPGSREVMADGEYGILVEDVQFPNALVELLGDSNRRQRLAEKGLQRAREYSLDKTMDQYELLIRELCAISQPVLPPACVANGSDSNSTRSVN